MVSKMVVPELENVGLLGFTPGSVGRLVEIMW
jgi:hypothetical protein